MARPHGRHARPGAIHGAGMLFERKLDGIRLLAFKQRKTSRCCGSRWKAMDAASGSSISTRWCSRTPSRATMRRSRIFISTSMRARVPRSRDPPRSDSGDPIYRRGVAEIHLGDFEAATRDLERSSGRMRSTTCIVHPRGSLKRTRTRVVPTKPTPCFARRLSPRRFLKPSSTTRRCWPHSIARRRHARGRRRSSTKSLPGPATCRDAGARGSAKPRLCSNAFRITGGQVIFGPLTAFAAFSWPTLHGSGPPRAQGAGLCLGLVV